MAFSFTDKLITDGNCTLIVDALNLAFRWKHQGRTDFRYEYQRTVESLAKSYDCKNIIITADLGSSSYRKEINPEYKQNRKEKFAEQSEQEKMEFEGPSLLKCRKCGKRKVEHYTKQTRSADEPETIFARCTLCNYRWRQ